MPCKFLLMVAVFIMMLELTGQKRPDLQPYRLSDQEIKIDGIAEEAVWQMTPVATDFVEASPEAGTESSHETRVRLLYSDVGLYLFAEMTQAEKNHVIRMTARDDSRNVDWFSFILDTYGKGIDGYEFGVTITGVQFDIIYTANGQDQSWNPVWESATTATENRWTVEMFVPYRSLRFPEADQQRWKANFTRNTEHIRETSYWSEVDPQLDGFLIQSGQLIGMQDIQSPLRLSIFPFVVNAFEWYHSPSSDTEGSTNYTFSGGADLKWGINEALTLDMTLVPDFSRALSDNQILNLTPFEVRFEEQRQFFQEGVDLFERGDIFFSRRIGGSPFLAGAVSDALAEGEEIIDQPATERLLNVSKVTGRSQKGTGVGILNAIAGRGFATVRDSFGGSRKELISPVTNYSVVVVDQNLNKNSYASVVNTNVWREGGALDANVSAIDFRLRDQNNVFGVSGIASLSQRFEDGNNDTGHRLDLAIGKYSGLWTYEAGYQQINKSYNPNDLGFLQVNNIRRVYLEGQYFNPEPKNQALSRIRHFTNIHGSWLEEEGDNTIASFFNNSFYLTKNFFGFGRYTRIDPIGNKDFFEPRVEGFDRFLANPGFVDNGAFISTNYSKTWAFDAEVAFAKFFEPGRANWFFNFSPRWRISDKALLILDSDLSLRNQDVGFVSPSEDGAFYDQLDLDQSFMSRRDVLDVDNILTLDYGITPYLSVNMRTRHNWTQVRVDDVFQLAEDGSLTEIDYNGRSETGLSVNDQNFNFFTVDLFTIWRFAPGSDLVFIWKNVISSSDNGLGDNYFDNLGGTFRQDQLNTFTVRAVYFLDYYLFSRKMQAKKKTQ